MKVRKLIIILNFQIKSNRTKKYTKNENFTVLSIAFQIAQKNIFFQNVIDKNTMFQNSFFFSKCKNNG